MAYKLAEEDKLCGVIYPTYEGFSPIPKATCEMLESKCEQTIIVKCKDNQSEEDKKPESQSGSASASASESSSESNSVSDSVSESTSMSESTTSVSNSQSESTLMSTSESKSESISASGSTSLSNSTTTSTSVSNSLSTTEPPSESELASTSLSEISSEEFVAHSNEISTIENSLIRVTSILNGMLNEEIYVRRGNPYKPMYLKETVLNALSKANSIYADKLYLSENLTVNDVHIDPKYKMDSEHEPDRVPLVFDITLPWGGRRTMVVPTFVRYLDEDIEKPKPDKYLEDHGENVPKLTKEKYDSILDNTQFLFGKAIFNGDTLISLRNTDGNEITKEDITNLEEYANKTLEDKLNEGRPESSRYKVKSKLVQINQVGNNVYNDKSINIFNLSLQITHPEGFVGKSSIIVNTVTIETL